MDKKLSICDKFNGLAKANGFRTVERGNLLAKYLDDDKAMFNYSGAHMHLVPALFNPTPLEKDKIAVIDQCIRASDIGVLGVSPSHLLSFTMAVYGAFGHMPDKKQERNFHLQNMIEFLDACGIDRDTLRFSVSAGGQFLDRQMPADKDSLEALLSLGIKPEQIVANKGRTNFMLSQGMVTSGMARPSGYNIEIYKDHKGKLIEVASSNIYDYLGKDGKLHDITNTGIGVGFGIERLDYVTRNLDSVYQTEFYDTIKDEIAKSLGMNNTAVRMFLDKIHRITEVGKTITLAINDGQEINEVGKNKTPRGKMLRSYLAKTASELSYMDIDPEKFIEILKPEMTKKYADPVYNVSIDDQAYNIFGSALKDEYNKKLGRSCCLER